MNGVPGMSPESSPAPKAQSTVTASRAGPPRCRRCQLAVQSHEREVYFLRLGLCFWCAHVEAQG